MHAALTTATAISWSDFVSACYDSKEEGKKQKKHDVKRSGAVDPFQHIWLQKPNPRHDPERIMSVYSRQSEVAHLDVINLRGVKSVMSNSAPMLSVNTSKCAQNHTFHVELLEFTGTTITRH